MHRLERLKKEVVRDGGFYEIVQMQARSFNALMKEHNIDHIDYVSIDTEGNERQIVESIDFDAIKIDAISLENNFGDPWFKAFLESKGFAYVTLLGNQDEIYVNIAQRMLK